jgi:ribosomal protein S18 acetylase RimI-like enzyme
MAAISEPLASSGAPQHMRPFDIHRDLAEVADLVELCFAETLDPDGRDYLARMRMAGRNTSFLRVAQGWASATMAGYVWVEEGKIVGNVSLIPYYLRARRFFLIANVAVHPSFRRRSIARRLTEKAIVHARDRLAPAVWLHVREENQAARQLYDSLGFMQRAIRTTWFGSPNYAPLETPPGTHFISPAKNQWGLLSNWLRRSYPPELSWHMPFHLNLLRPGMFGMFARLLYNAYVREWGIMQGKHLAAAAAWQATGSHTNVLWLAAPSERNEEAVRALLEHVLHHAPTRRSMVLDYPAGQYDQAIRQAGFNDQQTLVWMTLPFPQNQ